MNKRKGYKIFLQRYLCIFLLYFLVIVSLDRFMDVLLKGDRGLILQIFNFFSLVIRGVQNENVDYYVQRFDELKDIKQVEY